MKTRKTINYSFLLLEESIFCTFLHENQTSMLLVTQIVKAIGHINMFLFHIYINDLISHDKKKNLLVVYSIGFKL